MKKLHRFALAVVASAATSSGVVHAQEAPALLPLPQLIDHSYSQNVPETTQKVVPVVQQTGHHGANPWTKKTANPWSRYGNSASYSLSDPAAPVEETVAAPLASSSCDSGPESLWGESCGECLSSCGTCWFGGVYGLGMTRDNENRVWLSFDTSNPTASLLGSDAADMQYAGGYEIRFGRTFCGGRNAWEVVYWGIDSTTQEASAFDPAGGALNSTFDFRSLEADGSGLGAGALVNSFYDGAQVHRLRRGHEFHNIELNFLRLPQYNSGCGAGGLRVRGGAGVRFMKLDEYFQFASDDADTTFGSDNDEIFYDIEVENNLVGVQVGFDADYYLTRRFSLYANTKFGLFNNHIRHHSRIGNSLGDAVVGAGPNTGRAFNVNSSKDEVSFLGELRLGANYDLWSNWRLTGGYRAVAVTGVALTTNQMPDNYEDIDGVANIDSNGSMILHGFQAGIELNY